VSRRPFRVTAFQILLDAIAANISVANLSDKQGQDLSSVLNPCSKVLTDFRSLLEVDSSGVPVRFDLNFSKADFKCCVRNMEA